MCGIAGMFSRLLSLENATESLLRNWHALLKHRGPDDWGWYRNHAASVLFFHSRLSVTGVQNGRQPLSDESGRIWLTFNGEIYNYRELRVELEAAGHVFASDSDGEVIVHLYEMHGIASAGRLRGEFAFAIFDERLGEIHLVRDRFGIKPLYYAATPDGLRFGSEIKAIFADRTFTRRLDRKMLQNHLQTFYFADETLFENVRQVPPAHSVTYDLQSGNLTSRRYWQLPLGQPADKRNEQDFIAEFRQAFKEAVRIRLPEEVPYGAFLSGGLDSSAIVRTISGLNPGPFPVFSIGFDNLQYDELSYSNRLAGQLELPQFAVRIGEEDLMEVFLKSVWHSEIPVLNPHGAAKQLLAAEAKKHCKVVLTGEGADELLYGYGLFDHIRQFEHPDERKSGTGGRFSTGSLAGRLEAYRKVYSVFGAYPYPLKRYFYMRRISRFLLVGQARSDSSKWLWEKELPGHFGGDAFEGLNSLQATQRFLLESDFPSYLLNYLGDRQELAAGLEGRVPFLDHELAEFTCTLPDSMKLRGGTGKYILREMLRGQMDARLVDRSKRAFFAPALESIGFFTEPDFFNRFTGKAIMDSAGVFNPSFFRILTRAARLLPAQSKWKPILESVIIFVLSFQMVHDFFIRDFDAWQRHFAPLDENLDVGEKEVRSR